MANTKEIRGKISSIQSTQKITRAMEMVAASKMRKSQHRVLASRPYLSRIQEVISHLIKGKLEYTHPYLVARDVKKVAFLVISTDRGLCGGLNINLFKNVFGEMRQFDQKAIPSVICTIGKRAETFFVHHKADVAASVTAIGDIPKVKDLVGIMKVVTDAFDKLEVDEVYLCYNKFVSTLVQKPQIVRLLPVVDPKNEGARAAWDYIYEPDAATLLDILLHRYVESLIYQAAVENAACEQAARMMAMRNASDNAEELISDLRLIYNKARQAAITKELAEIVAGAAAV
ncbi:MAG TPA: F0F1 ATP synthase subunit gamma [Gammaproteobacteria bacterium]|nr:F0F1 ATP synthase subunit gamma [Gammaproteobacteria bacterium]